MPHRLAVVEVPEVVIGAGFASFARVEPLGPDAVTELAAFWTDLDSSLDLPERSLG